MDVEVTGKNTWHVEKWARSIEPKAKTMVFCLVLNLIFMVLLFGGGLMTYSVFPDQTIGHDDLFGGLLSPNFDNKSCISRYKSSIYRKPSPFPISPYLIQKLRNYEEYHKKCGPNTENYRKAVEQLKSGKKFENAYCQYIIWRPCGGTGNRMISLVSTFLYSLLTNRVMLLEMSHGMDALFCEPFPESSWILPNEFPIKDTPRFNSTKKKTRRIHRYSRDSYPSMVENKTINNNEEEVSAQSLPAYVFLPMQGGVQANHIFCENDQKILQKINWIIMKSDVYFAVSLFLMPMYYEEVGNMFPIKDSIFHILGRYLLHPANQVWELIERYYETYLVTADELIGLQIRLLPKYNVSFRAMFERILECSRTINLLPELNSTNLTNSVVKKRKAILITSLHEAFYEKITSMYKNSTATGKNIAVFQPSHEHLEHNSDGSHNQKALAEIFLLSYSDTIAITSWSTFGYVAYGLGGLKPWIIRSPRVMQAGLEGACVRSESIDPCLHVQPVLKCNGNADIDAAELVPFVRQCEDNDGLKGLKIFP